MFKKEKCKTDYVLVKVTKDSWDRNPILTFTSLEEAKQECNKKFYKLYQHNLPITVYSFKQTDTYTKKRKVSDVCWFNIVEEACKKEDIDKLQYVPVDYSYADLIMELNWGYYSFIGNRDSIYISPENAAKLKKIIVTDYPAYTIKGKDWPYWFKVENKLIGSATSNWFNYLYTTRNIVSSAALERYEGEDKYDTDHRKTPQSYDNFEDEEK